MIIYMVPILVYKLAIMSFYVPNCHEMQFWTALKLQLKGHVQAKTATISSGNLELL